VLDLFFGISFSVFFSFSARRHKYTFV